MKLFTCTINLGGSLLNQVKRDNITPAEIVILRVIHGDDAVNDIVETASVNRSDAKERSRLSGIYSKTTPKERLSGEDLVRNFLGIGVDLPTNVPEIVQPSRSYEEPESAEEEVITPLDAPPVLRTVVEKQPDRMAATRAARAANRDAAESLTA